MRGGPKFFNMKMGDEKECDNNDQQEGQDEDEEEDEIDYFQFNTKSRNLKDYMEECEYLILSEDEGVGEDDDDFPYHLCSEEELEASLGFTYSDGWPQTTTVPLDSLAASLKLQKIAKTEILHLTELWKNQPVKYTEVELRVRLGFALYGQPRRRDGHYEREQEDRLDVIIKLLLGRPSSLGTSSTVSIDGQEKKEGRSCYLLEVLILARDLKDDSIHRFFLFSYRRSCGDDDDDQSVFNEEEHFTDYSGRYYVNFQDWLQNNTLPPMEIIYPARGYYQVSQDGEVFLERGLTPAASLASTVTRWTDGIMAVTGICLTIAAFTAPPLLALGIGGGVLTAYSAGRASSQLMDRYRHGETVSPFDSNAREQWIDLGLSALSGTAGFLATKLFISAQRGKRILSAQRVMVKMFSATSLCASGLRRLPVRPNKRLNSSCRRRHKHLTALEALQTVVAKFFFTRSVETFREEMETLRKI